jgi:hypothetical protein
MGIGFENKCNPDVDRNGTTEINNYKDNGEVLFYAPPPGITYSIVEHPSLDDSIVTKGEFRDRFARFLRSGGGDDIGLEQLSQMTRSEQIQVWRDAREGPDKSLLQRYSSEDLDSFYAAVEDLYVPELEAYPQVVEVESAPLEGEALPAGADKAPGFEEVSASNILELLESLQIPELGEEVAGLPLLDRLILLNDQRSNKGQDIIAPAVLEEARMRSLRPVNKFNDNSDKAPLFEVEGDGRLEDDAISKGEIRKQFQDFVLHYPSVAVQSREDQIDNFNGIRISEELKPVDPEVLQDVLIMPKEAQRSAKALTGDFGAAEAEAVSVESIGRILDEFLLENGFDRPDQVSRRDALELYNAENGTTLSASLLANCA